MTPTVPPQTVRLKPQSPDIVLADPATGQTIPADGADVAMSGFWRRRVADGDAVIVDAASAKADSRPLNAKSKEPRT